MAGRYALHRVAVDAPELPRSRSTSVLIHSTRRHPESAVYIDAHAHLDDAAFDADRAAVLARARAAGVTGHVCAGVDPASWARQRALARSVPGVRWTAGLHPCVAATASRDGTSSALDALPDAFTGETPAVAVGETGLDTRFCERQTLEAQVAVFRTSLALARAIDRPVVLHLNGPGTHARALAVFRADGLPRAGGMVHAYSGSAELVRDYVALGLHVSFAATVCRPDARKVHAAARRVPGERLLVETDSPDLSPPSAPRRNEPAALRPVAAALAALRGEDPHELLVRSAAACEHLFGPFHAPFAGAPSTDRPVTETGPASGDLPCP
jgi:TatD DNase family protein